MPNDDEAKNAINELNELEVHGKSIVVNVAKPQTERSNNDRPKKRFNSFDKGYNSGKRYSRD